MAKFTARVHDGDTSSFSEFIEEVDDILQDYNDPNHGTKTLDEKLKLTKLIRLVH